MAVGSCVEQRSSVIFHILFVVVVRLCAVVEQCNSGVQFIRFLNCSRWREFTKLYIYPLLKRVFLAYCSVLFDSLASGSFGWNVGNSLNLVYGFLVKSSVSESSYSLFLVTENPPKVSGRSLFRCLKTLTEPPPETENLQLFENAQSINHREHAFQDSQNNYRLPCWTNWYKGMASVHEKNFRLWWPTFQNAPLAPNKRFSPGAV